MTSNITEFIRKHLNAEIEISWTFNDYRQHPECSGHHVRVKGRVRDWSVTTDSLRFSLSDTMVLRPSPYVTECMEPTDWTPFQDASDITLACNSGYEPMHGAHYSWYEREYYARIWTRDNTAEADMRFSRALVFLLDPRNKASITTRA